MNAAAQYPAMARLQGRQGNAKIAFDYRDGVVQHVVLLRSSHSRLLDDAALRAARRAHYPAPPARLAGLTLHMTVWVRFSLESDG